MIKSKLVAYCYWYANIYDNITSIIFYILYIKQQNAIHSFFLNMQLKSGMGRGFTYIMLGKFPNYNDYVSE